MLKTNHAAAAAAEAKIQTIKCVIWDLDHTVWDGILLEGDQLKLHQGVRETIVELDRRGILNSIASRNQLEPAIEQLDALGLTDYFLYPQINWNAKSESITEIAKLINIGTDALAFIDDQPFEREEVAFAHPDVLVIDSVGWDSAETILDHPRLNPRFITPESKLRRQMYQSDIHRNQAEAKHIGADEAFLATLDMKFVIKPADVGDLQRAEELTMRTNQLNTTGYTYNYDELAQLRESDDHLLLVSTLDDKYGPYGTIGLALVEKGAKIWTVKLLLMSCRVMSRGVGTIMMSHIMNLCKAEGAKLQAHFIPNGRNRMMYVTYKFGGFTEVDQQDDLVIFENDLSAIQPFPIYLKIEIQP